MDGVVEDADVAATPEAMSAELEDASKGLGCVQGLRKSVRVALAWCAGSGFVSCACRCACLWRCGEGDGEGERELEWVWVCIAAGTC